MPRSENSNLSRCFPAWRLANNIGLFLKPLASCFSTECDFSIGYNGHQFFLIYI